MNKSECQNETRKHIENVQKYMSIVIKFLLDRKDNHDKSKLESPELEIFTKYTPKLKESKYGSAQYKKNLKEMKIALDHHYTMNRHHPEYYKDGIKDMNLIDLIEMLCDWKSATLRHKTGDIKKSLEINQKRFGYSDELKNILYNTIDYMEKL